MSQLLYYFMMMRTTDFNGQNLCFAASFDSSRCYLSYWEAQQTLRSVPTTFSLFILSLLIEIHA